MTDSQKPPPTPDEPKTEGPTVWIDLLPKLVQYRIADYVSEGYSGRDALSLAQTSPEQRHAVSASLEYELCNRFASHAESLVPDWIPAFENVQALELWEHPPNFSMLSSSKLRHVILEDEPMQVNAVTESRVRLECFELYVNYGTPSHLIVRMCEQVGFTELEIDDSRGLLFEAVDVPMLAQACRDTEHLNLSTTVANQDAVADFINRLPRLTVLELVMDAVEISFKGLQWGAGKRLTVTALGVYLTKVRWFESFDLLPELKELWLKSDEGWGDDEILQFSSAVIDLPALEELKIKVQCGAERFFPRISSLKKLHMYWTSGYDVTMEDELHYKPEEGVVPRIIAGLPALTDLKLRFVRLTDEEVVQIVKTVGDSITAFGMSVDRQDVACMERVLTLIKALTNYAKGLIKLSGRYNESETIFRERPAEHITARKKQEILMHFDRLHRSVPIVCLRRLETCILDWPEVPDYESTNDEKEEELQKSFRLRRCRRGMNETGDPKHMVALAKLLETGCNGLRKDRKKAIELYKRAIELGEQGDALLNLWRLTEDPKDSSSEPRPNGAFQLIMDMDKSGTRKLPMIAELFLNGTLSTDAQPAAAEKLLELAIDRGLTFECSTKLAHLVLKGYDDVPPNPYRAFELYKLAIDEHNDPEAMFHIADLLTSGYGEEPKDPAAARVYLERGVRLGWSPCMNDLAILLHQGYDGVAPDRDAAISWYEKAISKGNTVAMGNLALLYVGSYHGEASIAEKAIELLERAIAHGNHAVAMRSLGAIYEDGYEGVAPNPQRAQQLYVQAIEAGDFVACYYLGTLVSRGYRDVPPDPDEAIRLYEMAIGSNDSRARVMTLNAYGLLMESGAGNLKADPVKAVELYRKSISEGGIVALFNLADLFESGKPGVERDFAEAYELFSQAAKEEHNDIVIAAKAMRRLGELHQMGFDGLTADPYKAVELYKRAINAGDFYSYDCLGQLVETGYGDEPPDLEEAARIYQKGVDEGDPDAMSALGLLIERGYGDVCPDPQTASDLYRRAIDVDNDAKAMFHLATLMERGYLDNPPDYEGALALHERAAKNDIGANISIARLLQGKYEGVEPDRERARVLYLDVIEKAPKGWDHTVVEAMNGLGVLLEENAGDDVEKLDEAISWYEQAINRTENSASLYYLAELLPKRHQDGETIISEVVALLQRAVKYDSAEPYFLLADYVRNGYDDVEPDTEQARELEEKGCMILWHGLSVNWKQ